MPTPIVILNCILFPTAFSVLFPWANISVPVEQSKARLIAVTVSSCIRLTVCRGSRSRVSVSSVFPNVVLLKRKLSSEQRIDIEYDGKYDLGRDLVIIQKFPPTEYH